MHYQTKDLFQLQTELVETKVNMAASTAIERVLERIDILQKDMDARFSALERDMVAVKTRLGMIDDTRGLIRAKLIDYAFRAGWLILAAIGVGLSYTILYAHFLN